MCKTCNKCKITYEDVEENFHKTLLSLYETKFKPDLLKALEENK